jgi:hypothetical protein
MDCAACNMNVSMDTSNLDLSTTTEIKRRKRIEDYEIVNHLGKGAYGEVKLVKEKEDPSKMYAMKIVSDFDIY